MLIVSPQTVANTSALETRSLPKKLFGRVLVIPKSASLGLWLRLLFELQLLRYLGALLPFVALPLVFRDLALPVTQAPLAMLIVIAFVELKVLRHSDRSREALMSEDKARSTVDLLAFRGKGVLRQFAARNGQDTGPLAMVIEQSELARVAPLTFVSIQSSVPNARVVDLTPEDQAAIAQIFDDELSERDLHRANQRLTDTLLNIQIEASAVSAHARLASWIEARNA